MSAYVVSKEHVDVLVRFALHGTGREPFRWWAVDDDGDFAAWRELDERAECQGPEEQERRGLVTPSQLGQVLVNENVRSVSFRYSEPGRTYYYGPEHAGEMDDLDPDAGELPGPCDAYYMGPYVYTDPGYTLTPAELFAAIDCLDYQSCEHDGWRTSEAYALLRQLRQDACRMVEGFEDAPREWDAEELARRPRDFSVRLI